MTPIEIQSAIMNNQTVYWKSLSYKVVLHNSELYLECGNNRTGIYWPDYNNTDFFIQ